MSPSSFKLNEDAFRRLQAKANMAGQNVVRDVNARLAGRPVPEVMAALRDGMVAAGMEPNDQGLAPYAESISAGTLEE